MRSQSVVSCNRTVRISIVLKRFFSKCSSRADKDPLKHGGSVWLTLSIVDNVSTVYDVRRRRKFGSECRCSCSASNVAFNNVSPDFATPVFGFEDHRRNHRELEVVERSTIIILSFLDWTGKAPNISLLCLSIWSVTMVSRWSKVSLIPKGRTQTIGVWLWARWKSIASAR